MQFGPASNAPYSLICHLPSGKIQLRIPLNYACGEYITRHGWDVMFIVCLFFCQVMVACFEVFQTWDDEYEKLQVLLRDIVKRKREENLKMVWRINPAHRKLQARLDQMRKFRRQHEQLRAVIVRVLRPQVIPFVSFCPAATDQYPSS